MRKGPHSDATENVLLAAQTGVVRALACAEEDLRCEDDIATANFQLLENRTAKG